MAKEEFRRGERVEWDSSGGTARGRVVEKTTKPGHIKDFDYQASEEHPKYIVETDEGERAAHRPEELRRAKG